MGFINTFRYITAEISLYTFEKKLLTNGLGHLEEGAKDIEYTGLI